MPAREANTEGTVLTNETVKSQAARACVCVNVCGGKPQHIVCTHEDCACLLKPCKMLCVNSSHIFVFLSVCLCTQINICLLLFVHACARVCLRKCVHIARGQIIHKSRNASEPCKSFCCNPASTDATELKQYRSRTVHTDLRSGNR